MGTATCQERREKGRLGASPLSLEQPIGIGQDPEAGPLLAFIVGVLRDVELAVHQDLQTLLDVLTALGEFAKGPDREEVVSSLAVLTATVKSA